MSAQRDPSAESARLHRARRAAERAELDSALAAADTDLQGVKDKCAEAVLYLVRGRTIEALHRMADVVQDVERARRVLREYFDQYGSRDDDD